ncbi:MULTISPECIES: hypothetical protein [Haloferax]|uniref:Uncharacterized protein n=1 Tax=Haloferax marinum TaxID=2666143 RepID=A0A6A8G288_9EURY|nr:MULTISPECIES: hypothetical protein [Haloferax]KAB1196164.1 hypothetical protein Hfx1150_01020 [Haloferax sp. CBA1150]MRW95151.1 hypothetical protein [Haloferax marinum]
MPTTHLSVLGLDVQRVVTPLETGDFGADRVRLVRDEADPEQGRDPDDCAAGPMRARARVARTISETLGPQFDSPLDEVRLPFDAPFVELYAATTDLLRSSVADGDVVVNLTSAPPQVAAAFYAARTALVDTGVTDDDAITLFTVPADERLDLAAVSALRAVVSNVETTTTALDEFAHVADGPAATAVARPLRIALSDLRNALAEASGDSRGSRRRPSYTTRSKDDSTLDSMSAYVGRAREQLADFVESDQPTPDPSDTRDPNVVLDALDSWLDAETALLSPVEDDPRELLARFRESCDARFGKFEDDATIVLFETIDRFEEQLDAYLDARTKLSEAYRPVSEAMGELTEGTATAADRLDDFRDAGVARGETPLSVDGHSLSPLGDLEAIALHVLTTGPPRSRPRTRRAVTAHLRERAEHHGIVAGARDEESWTSFEAFCVDIARNGGQADAFEKRLSNALRPRLDVAVEALLADGYVRIRERETGRDALEPTDSAHLWSKTTDWDEFRETVVDDVLRDCVERELD